MNQVNVFWHVGIVLLVRVAEQLKGFRNLFSASELGITTFGREGVKGSFQGGRERV